MKKRGLTYDLQDFFPKKKVGQNGRPTSSGDIDEGDEFAAD